jgi:hypothetical protein
MISPELSKPTKEMEDEFLEMYFATFLLGAHGPHPELVCPITMAGFS